MMVPPRLVVRSAPLLRRRHGGPSLAVPSGPRCRLSTVPPAPAPTTTSSDGAPGGGTGGGDEKEDDDDHGRRVTTTVDPSTGICHVVLSRPSKLNAVDMAMFEAIAGAARDLRTDRSIRAVILSGKGRAFCTGLDVSAVLRDGTNPLRKIERLLERPSGYGTSSNGSGGDTAGEGGTSSPVVGNLAQDVSILWREVPVPVIAVLHGMCYGAGLQIALGADFRYSTPDCKLSVMEAKWGLIPDMGASLLLRELVRIDVAKDLTMTGKIVTGREAATLGLVTRVCDDPLREATEFATSLLDRSPDAIAAAKELYHTTWTSSTGQEALEAETKLQRRLLMSWNQLAASGRSALGWGVPYLNRKD
jgi:enoyl-CoA hydratase/carnithine racemase